MSATAGGGLGFAANDRVPSVDVEPCTALSVSLKLARQRRRLTAGIAAREESVHCEKKNQPGGPAGPPPAGLHLVGVVRDTLSVVLPAACLRDRSGVCSADLRGGERSNGTLWARRAVLGAPLARERRELLSVLKMRQIDQLELHTASTRTFSAATPARPALCSPLL